MKSVIMKNSSSNFFNVIVLMVSVTSPTIGIYGFVYEPLSLLHNHNQHQHQQRQQLSHRRHQNPCLPISQSQSHLPTTRLFLQSPRVRFNNNNNNNDNDNNNNDITNPFDRFFSLISSDSFSILVGSIGLLAVVVHRWNIITSLDIDSVGGDFENGRAAAEALTTQTRSDLLAVFACGSVLLNGLTKIDVTTALAESVVLEGIALSEPELTLKVTVNEQDTTSTTTSTNQNDDDNDDTTTTTTTSISSNSTLSWALQSLLVATPAKTVIIITTSNTSNDEKDDDQQQHQQSSPPPPPPPPQWTIHSRAGIVPFSSTASTSLSLSSSSTTVITTSVPDIAPILDRVGSPTNRKETYLPTLQRLPGRNEFSYLPTNTQLALLIPISKSSSSSNNNNNNNIKQTNSVLVIGGNTAKSFTPRDIAWSRIIAERLGDYM